jgi:Bacterial membrane protein YfhO
MQQFTTNIKQGIVRYALNDVVQGAVIVTLMALVFLGTPLLQSKDHYYSVAGMLQAFPLLNVQQGDSPNNTLLGDTITQIQPYLMYNRESLRAGKIPMWNPYNANGIPHLANYQSAIFSLFNLPFYILSFRLALVASAFAKLFALGFFTFLFLRSLGLRRMACWVGATAFMFNGLNIVWLNFLNTSIVVCLPASLYFIEKTVSRFKNAISQPDQQPRAYSTSMLWPLVGLTVSLAIGLLGGHPDTFIFCLLLIVAYTIFRLTQLFLQLRRNQGKFGELWLLAGRLVLSGVLAAGLAAVQIVPFLEYVSISAALGRAVGPGFVSLRADLWPLLIFPDLFGVGSGSYQAINGPGLWTNYNEANSTYAGGLVVFLTLLSIGFIRRDKRIIFFLGTIAVWAACAYNMWGFGSLLAWIPGIKVVAIQRSQLIWLMSASCCAALAVHHLLGLKRERATAAGLGAAILGLAFLAGSIAGAFWLLQQHLDLILPAASQFLNEVPAHIATMSVTMIAGILCVVMISMVEQSALKLSMAGVIVLAIFLETGYLLKGYNTTTSDALFFPATPSLQQLENIVGNDRVVMVGPNTIPPDTNMIYKIPLLTSYDAMGVSWQSLLLTAEFGAQMSKVTPTAAVIFGARYVLISDPKMQLSAQFELVATLAGNGRLYRDNASPSAYYTVNQARFASTDDDAFAMVQQADFDPAKTVVLMTDAGPTGGADAATPAMAKSAQVVAEEPTTTKLKTNCVTRCYLVITVTYYPGWKARVNGVESPILRANYAFNAIELGPGESSVEFYYDPDSFKYGLLITILAFIAGLVCILTSIQPGSSLAFWRRKPEQLNPM